MKSSIDGISRSYLTNTPINKAEIYFISEEMNKRYLLGVYIEDFGIKNLGSSQVWMPGANGSSGYMTTQKEHQKGLVVNAKIYDGVSNIIVWEKRYEVGAKYIKGKLIPPYTPKDEFEYIQEIVKSLTNSLPI